MIRIDLVSAVLQLSKLLSALRLNFNLVFTVIDFYDGSTPGSAPRWRVDRVDIYYRSASEITFTAEDADTNAPCGTVVGPSLPDPGPFGWANVTCTESLISQKIKVSGVQTNSGTLANLGLIVLWGTGERQYGK